MSLDPLFNARLIICLWNAGSSGPECTPVAAGVHDDIRLILYYYDRYDPLLFVVFYCYGVEFSSATVPRRVATHPGEYDSALGFFFRSNRLRIIYMFIIVV